jgi:hypothetical protein
LEAEVEAKEAAARERLEVAQRRKEAEEAKIKEREREKGKKMAEAKAIAQQSKLLQVGTQLRAHAAPTGTVYVTLKPAKDWGVPRP